MDPLTLKMLFDAAFATITLIRTSMEEGRDPTPEELAALEDRNNALIADVRKRIEARPG